MRAQYRQLFIIEGKYLGESPRSPIQSGDSLLAPQGFAFFCFYCGEVFARCPVTLEEVPQPWQYRAACCRRCAEKARPFPRSFPGSIWDDYAPKSFLAAFPPEVLRRELLLHLEYALWK